MSKHEVGLCVCYDTKNFGSQLQVLATQQSIANLGYDYEIIIYKKALSPVFVFQSVLRLFNPYFVNGKLKGYTRKKQIARHSEIQKQVNIRNRRFDNFVKNNFTKLSKPYKGYKALKRGAEKYDVVLTGSDQLWLPQNLGSHFYTQEFVAEHIKKVAYAPSFGVSQIPWFQKTRTRKYLKRFDCLSSRELRGSQIIKELTGIEAVTVCDPTLLLSSNEWLELIPNSKIIDEPYIFAYFLGENESHREEVKKLSEAKKLPVITIPFLDHYVECDNCFGDKQLFDVDSMDFVNLIRNAEYVCTDSFHGSVFSILNHKRFATFSRFSDSSKQSRNSRIESLFIQTGLQNRHCEGDIVNMIDDEIDYAEVDIKVNDMREKSKEYLKNAINYSKN